MQIAIVDDRAEDREELSACLENYMKKHQLDYTLTEFEDGENFLKAAAQVNFQLVFMDIYMENMDGMEAARRLRQKNRLCKIVFLTITEDYARMGYSLSASYYLLKPLSLHQADFEEAMELCQLKPPYEVMTLSVMAGRQKLELPTEKILYIDYQNRMTRIHTAERVIPVSGGFQEVTAALQKDKRFLPCYRGILINMDYISHVDSQAFRLINGEELPIALAMENSCGKPTVSMFSLEWGVSYENETNTQAYSGGLSGLPPLLDRQYPYICRWNCNPSQRR